MGYTNYWTQKTDFTDSEWSKIKMEADYVRSWSEISTISKYVGVDIKKDKIEIVGACETFVLNKFAKVKPDYEGQDVSLHFCKTRETVYDLAVWHLLTACAYIKSDFEISRDNHNIYEKTETVEIESDKPLAVKFKSNDYCENNELPFDQVKYFQMFDEDNEDKTKTTWVRFKLKNKLKGRKANGFISAIDNVLNMEQVKDNILRRLWA